MRPKMGGLLDDPPDSPEAETRPAQRVFFGDTTPLTKLGKTLKWRLRELPKAESPPNAAAFGCTLLHRV